nr:alpha-glucosidase [uncultured Albidiferax sp.]
MAPAWWKGSVVYQIYPRSFCDSNGDGVGDLRGITSKLDYLQTLGVDVVWLSPIYPSPNDDGGYDISDYRAIAPEFGSMADFDQMLAQMHQRGIRLVMDLVVNHTSDEHPWFTEACKSKDNPYRNYYIWRAPAADGGPPTNWEAAFSGSTWEFHVPTGEYYLHLFSKKQPELNWENPRVRAEVHGLMRFWLEKGVDGFRMDVINMVSKTYAADGSLQDAPVLRPGFLQPAFTLVTNGPRLLEFLQEMRREVLDDYDTLTVGEAPCATIRQGVEITHPDTGALNMLFQFEHMDLDSVPGHGEGKWALKTLDLRDLKACLTRWQDGLAGQGWNSLYLGNHDQPRPVSRFGNDSTYRVESAKMLATLLHGMQGTPYVYQGEELGMTNKPYASEADCYDLESINMYRSATQERGIAPEVALQAIRRKGRDNARTPMQWNANPHAGFTTGTPWQPVNPNYPQIHSQAALLDTNSVFHYYRQLIALRKAQPVLVHGRYQLLLAEHPEVYAYLRTLGDERWLVLCNFYGGTPVLDLPYQVAQRVIANYPSAGTSLHNMVLRPFEAAMFRLE